MHPLLKDQRQLLILYEEQQLSVPEISYRYDISTRDINRALRRFGIYRGCTTGRPRSHPVHYPDSFYLQRIVVEKKTKEEVADELGVTPNAIAYQLKMRGIEQVTPGILSNL